MGLPQIDRCSFRNDFGRVQLGDRIIVDDVVAKFYRLGDARYLVKVAHIVRQVGVVRDTFLVALEEREIRDIETDQGREQSPVGLGDTLRAEQRVEIHRRELLGFAAVGLVAAGASTGPVGPVHRSLAFGADLRAPFDVRSFGATADGKTIDTPAVNQAISAAAAAGGGIVRFGAGVYVCYSIRLKSLVTLCLEPGAIILGRVDAFAPDQAVVPVIMPEILVALERPIRLTPTSYPPPGA